ncbi:MAG: HAMP domain-containing histidine kinase [Deltaproteobacteria bacterium]|nr:MAG: HAMP domain-containing histidine kinase [Deltaproteobacteria bacterium]
MRTGLAKKLLFYTGGILALLLLLTFMLLERNQAEAWEDYLFSQSLSFSRLATPELLKRFRGSFPPDEPADIADMHEFLGLNRDLVQFSLVSATGRRLYVSNAFEDFPGLDLHLFDQDDISARLAAERTTMLTHKLAEGRRLLDLLEPAFGPTGQQVVSVRYLISYDSIDARLLEARSYFVMIAIAALLGCLLMVSLVARRITRPIANLTDGAHSLTRGELGTRIEVQGRDEIGTLAQAFNNMAESLAANRAELTRKNDALSTANEEMQTMQAQLLRSERLAAIGQLAAGVSHEIDNPVGIILGHAELLLEDLEVEDPLREDVAAIIDECRRCKRITGGLLGFARSPDSYRERVDLNQLAEEVVSSLRPQKLFKDLDLKIAGAREDLSVTADADQLRQVMINLLLNAAQALQGRGRLEVTLSRVSGSARIQVDDSGPGISLEDQERVFQPFFSTKAQGEGTGLGLPLCRKLVEGQEGEISIQKSHLGGACLTVLLPLSE